MARTAPFNFDDEKISKFRTVNISILSKNTKFLSAVFFDVIKSVHSFFDNEGFTVFETENVLIPDALNIIFGLGNHNHIDYSEFRRLADKESTVVFNLEQLGWTDLANEEYLEILNEYYWYDYNFENIKRGPTNICAREFPLFPAIESSPFNMSTTKNFDIGFYGAPSTRRFKTLNELQNHGLRVGLFNSLYGDELSACISQCRLILNLHAAEESSIFEIARCLRPVAMGVPIVSEESILPATIDWRNAGIEFVKYENIVHNCINLLSNENIDKITQLSNASIKFTYSHNLSQVKQNLLLTATNNHQI